MDLPPRRARGRSGGGGADRRPALGRGRATRPLRSWITGRPRAAAPPGNRAPGAHPDPARLGQRGSRRGEAPARRADSVGHSPHGRRADTDIAACVSARPRPRARGGQSILRRGAHSHTDRARRARATQRRLGGAGPSGRRRRSRHGAGCARGAHRPAGATGKGGPAGGRRDRPNVLGWSCRRAVGRRRSGPARPRGPRLHTAAVELESRRDAQVEIWREIGHAQAIYFDGKAFSSAMQRAIELADDDLTTADLYAELAFQTLVRAGMWGVAPDASLVEGWIGSAL